MSNLPLSSISAEPAVSIHLGYVLVVLTYAAIGMLQDYRSVRRDWCGIAQLPALLPARLPMFVCVTLVYLHLIHMIPLPLLGKVLGPDMEQYAMLAYNAAAILAEYVARRLLTGLGTKDGRPLYLSRAITRQKLKMADRLQTHPRATLSLIDAIQTSKELSHAKKAPRIAKLKNHSPPSREEILQVIEDVGLAQIIASWRNP